MTILQVHKFYWRRDGASNYMLQLSDLLQKAGHTVIPFAMQDAQNLPTPYDKWFVSTVDLSLDSFGRTLPVSLGRRIKYFGRILYSLEAKKKMRQLLDEQKIDVVHLHNIYHHISPSILPAIKKRKIPIVMTLHDYKLLCPNYTMFHHGGVHEEDGRGWYFSCAKNKCMRDSRRDSIAVTAEMIFHHKIMKYYERFVDRFIAPSEFMIDLCVKFGWPREKFVHIPHPIHDSRITYHDSSGDAVVYAGRLSEEKGLQMLLGAAAKTPQILYRIVGTGPLEGTLKKAAQHLKLRNVIFDGFQTGDALQKILADARLMVLPSLWYENYPLSILEASARGVVTIASDIGGIPELLPKKLLTPPGDIDALAEAIAYWHRADDERRNMGERLREEAMRVNEPVEHVKSVMQLYESFV